MSTSSHTQTELQQFSSFVVELLAKGQTKLSPEDAVETWRSDQASNGMRDDFEEVDEEEVRAIQEALDDIATGDRGMPAEVVMREMARKHGL